MKQSSTPSTPSQSSTPAVGSKPMASATASTSTVENRLRSTLATTCPVSGAAAGMGSDRKRSVTPVVMSVFTLTEVVAAP